MNILLFIVLGGIAGWIASIAMGTNARQGLLGDILLGIVGAILGGFAISIIGGSGITGFNFYSLFVAVLGSIILIWIGRRMYHYN